MFISYHSIKTSVQPTFPLLPLTKAQPSKCQLRYLFTVENERLRVNRT